MRPALRPDYQFCSTRRPVAAARSHVLGVAPLHTGNSLRRWLDGAPTKHDPTSRRLIVELAMRMAMLGEPRAPIITLAARSPVTLQAVTRIS